MFDYPIPPLRSGLYEQLGLGPEATAEEISDARQELVSRLQAEKTAIDRELETVYQQVGGLRELYRTLERLDEAGTDADPDEYRRAQLELVRLEEQARAVNPRFSELRERAGRLEREIHELNQLSLQNPEKRLAYDRSNPPFALIKLADGSRTAFDDNKLVLALVRTELSDFLEQAGETVYHPSDLTRVDFSSDFSENSDLDRLP